MSLVSILKEALDEVTSLQVATLYGSGITLEAGIDQDAKAELEQKIADQQGAVTTARKDWLAATDLGDRMSKHRLYRDAKGRLNELQQELNGVSPRDIFAKIQLAMGTGKTAGYTRLELGGNSTNYLDMGLGQEHNYLIEAHKANVQAAQEARQRIIDAATNLLKLGESI